MLKNILDKYNVEYELKDNIIDIWRNGKNLEIKQDINLDVLELCLDRFCVESPASLKTLKRNFPKQFEKPVKGSYIAVKRYDNHIDMYQMKEFVEFRDKKIICLSKSGKEKEYDLYQIIDGDNHPSTTFWINSYGNLVPWLVLEKINEDATKVALNDTNQDV